ncbi:TPA: hypothetical protein IUT89_000864 [Enterococcus faecalis]|uniref:hypothetical protein n=1 Tax=Enterococcus faecalis TaxID=1351 RepID=UPI001C187BE2|nr:hypothetical protein [Enterococcus faecalis]HAP3771983.1 hypothetical protein [Enterococcus faecalis]HAP3830100.1 hypothetical protein [Enterococcus faecalis]HBE2152891.1 hypothetical protein [Enterococcus faecalis]HCY9045757.1 hypothetical protein [Enterococcus faecalis]
MKEELLLFVEKFVARMKRQKKAFSISDIEKSYNLERKKLGKNAVKLTNMERLTIESRLLKNQILQRTYKMAGYHKPYQVVFFSKT